MDHLADWLRSLRHGDTLTVVGMESHVGLAPEILTGRARQGGDGSVAWVVCRLGVVAQLRRVLGFIRR